MGRGLIRLWVLGTVLWVLIVSFWLGWPVFDEMLHPERYLDPLRDWLMLARTALGPPIVVLTLGAAIGWVLQGFRSAAE